MPHLVLVGDSIFDNASYTEGGPDVVSQVRGLLPTDWKAMLLAVDGSVTDDVSEQLGRLPEDATYIVLSVGGNDALRNIGMLEAPTSKLREALEILARMAWHFEARYRECIEACLQTRLPLAVCTIYNGNFDNETEQRIASTTLKLFNDAIIRAAVEYSLPVIDLRFICCNTEDYANPIEPSSIGGHKIAKAIVGLVSGARATANACRIIVA